MTDISARLRSDDLRPFLRTIEMATPEQAKRLGADAADHIDAQDAKIAELQTALDNEDGMGMWRFWSGKSAKLASRNTSQAATIKALEADRDEWKRAVGHLLSAVPVYEVVGVGGSIRDLAEWMKARHRDTKTIKTLVEALVKCRDELDAYSQNEYPSDHPVHIAHRERDYDANPARIAIAAAEGTK